MPKIATIIIERKDLPKERDLNIVGLINRGGKGAHMDRRKDADKKACRQKVSNDDE